MIDEQWNNVFEKAHLLARQNALLISPFLRRSTLRDLLGDKPKYVRVITRFNLDDFQRDASDINALEYLLNIGAQVKGVKNLHSKVYIFGSTRAIVTSANLTQAALSRNAEFGIESDDNKFLRVTTAYFEQLWNKAYPTLNTKLLTKWKREIAKSANSRSNIIGGSKLPDYGADLGFEESTESYTTGATPGSIDIKSFMAFCASMQGRKLTTVGGRANFYVKIQNGILRYRPAVSGNFRSHTSLEDVLKRYNEFHLSQPKDYHDLTWNASYTLALIKLFVTEQAKL